MPISQFNKVIHSCAVQKHDLSYGLVFINAHFFINLNVS